MKQDFSPYEAGVVWYLQYLREMEGPGGEKSEPFRTNGNISV